MAPKNPPQNTRAATKRKNTTSSQPSRPPRATPFDDSRFLSAYHQRRYQNLVRDKLWYERAFPISPEGPYKEIYDLFAKQRWLKLLTPPESINVEIVHEFYANAMPNPVTAPFTFRTCIRGREIFFDRDAINEYLGNPYELADPSELCDYHGSVEHERYNIPELEQTIMKPGYFFDQGDTMKKTNAKNKNMTLPAQVCLRLIIHNIRPNSHTSSTTMEVCALIWYILKGIRVDIARTISREMQKVACQGKCYIGFPALVMGLIQKARMVLPPTVHEKLQHPIDDAFIAKNMEKKKKRVRKYAASTSQAHPPPPEPPTIPPQVSSDFSSFAQWQYQCNTYTWDQNEALNRSNTAVHRSVYNAQMHPGDANYPVMTPEEFQAYVAWPEVRPNAFGGGGCYAGNVEERADDDGDNDGDDDGGNQDDPDRVHSANTSGSDDDFYRDDMQE